jgi:hypothetical protein
MMADGSSEGQSAPSGGPHELIPAPWAPNGSRMTVAASYYAPGNANGGLRESE